MLPPEIFEQLLASYPAEKRELARQIFHRFTDSPGYGDFFSELCVALDVYAFYMERIPQAVIAADQSALTALAKLRDEVNLLAQGMDKRNLNIANLAGRTQELCRMTQAKCFTNEVAFTVANKALQVVGGRGYLKGHAAELKETTIGVEAFGRATDYDPKTDTVVRTQTWRLRRKLRTYYSAEGTSDPVLIEIPIGHYVPVFHSRGV